MFAYKVVRRTLVDQVDGIKYFRYETPLVERGRVTVSPFGDLTYPRLGNGPFTAFRDGHEARKFKEYLRTLYPGQLFETLLVDGVPSLHLYPWVLTKRSSLSCCDAPVTYGGYDPKTMVLLHSFRVC